MIAKDSISVVVRSADERTTDLCSSLLKDFFSGQFIHVLKTSPFSKAIVESWRIGIEAKKEWVLCIDADVLISPHGMQNLLEKADGLPPDTFEIQGLVLDKFFPV